MHQTKHFAYVETTGEQVLTIPYNSGFNMTVVLPKKGQEALQAWRRNSDPEPTALGKKDAPV